MQGKGLHLMHGRGQRQDKKGRETSRSQRRLAVMETASAQWQHGYQLAARAAHEASDLAALEGARRMHRPRGATPRAVASSPAGLRRTDIYRERPADVCSCGLADQATACACHLACARTPGRATVPVTVHALCPPKQYTSDARVPPHPSLSHAPPSPPRPHTR